MAWDGGKFSRVSINLSFNSHRVSTISTLWSRILSIPELYFIARVLQTESALVNGECGRNYALYMWGHERNERARTERLFTYYCSQFRAFRSLRSQCIRTTPYTMTDFELKTEKYNRIYVMKRWEILFLFISLFFARCCSPSICNH